MKRLMTWLAVVLMAFSAFAQHKLDYMMMNVVLNTNGDAYVQELRQMFIGNSGTENYISFYNLPDGMELKDLSVREDTVVYTFDKYWDINRSRAQKAFHCGFNYTDLGTEVCWGVGDTGIHTYVVRYVITNLVRSYEESDGFNHSFYEAATPAARDAFVVIHAIQRNDSVQFTPQDIWNLPYFQVTNMPEWVDRNIVNNEDPVIYETVDADDPTKQEGMTPWGTPVEPVDENPMYSLLQLRQMADSMGITIDSLAEVLAKKPAVRTQQLVAELDKPVELKLDTLRHPAVKAWAFGYEGYLEFYPNGSIRAMNDSLPMSSGESFIIMAEFEKGMFLPKMRGEVTRFETVKERAFYDSDYSLDDEEDGIDKRASFMGGSDTPMWENRLVEGLAAIFLLLIVGLPLWGIIHVIRRLIWGKKIDQKKWDKKLSKLIGQKVDELPYYRDPPADGQLTVSQRILAGLRPNDGLGISHLIEAFMMRMLYKGSIQITTETTEKGKVRDVFLITEPEKMNNSQPHKDHQQLMGLYSSAMQEVIARKEKGLGVKIDDENLENLLHKLLYAAAGEDHLLQPDELKDYIEKNPLKVRPYASAVNYMVNANVYLGYLPKEESKQVYGFHKFLKDFTLVNEREMSEVSLWKEYLVYASLYGLADEVRKGMKKVAPDVMKLDKITSMLLASGASAVLVGSLIDTMQKSYRYAQLYKTTDEIKAEKAAAAAAARAAARASSVRRYSGGGGHSSYSGGGGHSGGGGSGVR